MRHDADDAMRLRDKDEMLELDARSKRRRSLDGMVKMRTTASFPHQKGCFTMYSMEKEEQSSSIQPLLVLISSRRHLATCFLLISSSLSHLVTMVTIQLIS